LTPSFRFLFLSLFEGAIFWVAPSILTFTYAEHIIFPVHYPPLRCKMNGGNGGGGVSGGCGGIVGVGVVAILLIILGAWLAPTSDWKWALVLTGIGILLALVAGATFNSSWVIGVVFGVAALVVFGFALRAFSHAINPEPQTATPTPTALLLLLGIVFPRLAS
jgi:hypothetical protein